MVVSKVQDALLGAIFSKIQVLLVKNLGGHRCQHLLDSI